MRQGKATREGSGIAFGHKYDPVSKVVDVRAVGQMGTALGNHSTDHGSIMPTGGISYNLYPGKVGFQAPPMRKREYDCGSQGSY